MRTLLLTFALAIGLGASAQNRPTEAQRAEQRAAIEQAAAKETADMTKDLQLTEEQAMRVGEVNKTHMRDMENVQALKDAKGRAGREKVLNDHLAKSYRTILTPEQFTKWEDRRAEKDAKKTHNE